MADFNQEQLNRIKQTLNQPEGSFEANVSIAAIYIDIVQSSSLTLKHDPFTLSKIYKAFINETVTVMDCFCNLIHSDIQGDGVLGIFEIDCTSKLNEIINCAKNLSGMVRLINIELAKMECAQIPVGIGISYGAAFVMQAGNERFNNKVWIGNVVNEAVKMSSIAGRNGVPEIIIGNNMFKC